MRNHDSGHRGAKIALPHSLAAWCEISCTLLCGAVKIERRMKIWKIALLVVTLAASSSGCLIPHARSAPNEPGIVEITYAGDAGANSPVMDDAFRAFETESRELHQEKSASSCLSRAQRPSASLT